MASFANIRRNIESAQGRSCEGGGEPPAPQQLWRESDKSRAEPGVATLHLKIVAIETDVFKVAVRTRAPERRIQIP
jgi:hypothetical protein